MPHHPSALNLAPETLLQARLSLLVEQRGLIHFLESLWMKPVRPHEYFF